MQKLIPLTAFALLLSACGGGNGGDHPQLSVNVTGSWSGNLETPTGGGLGGVEANLVQSTAPASDFKGNISSPMYGGNHPVVGDVKTGVLKSDMSSGQVNEALGFTCTGTFTNNSYRGDCTMNLTGTKYVLVLGRK